MEDTVLHDIKVPIDWVCTYRQIQSLLIDYGVSAIVITKIKTLFNFGTFLKMLFMSIIEKMSIKQIVYMTL